MRTLLQDTRGKPYRLLHLRYGGRYPFYEQITADFTYIRLHGSRVLYSSEYTDDELVRWAQKIASWKRETFVYFDNTAAGHAPANALRLKELLGLTQPP